MKSILATALKSPWSGVHALNVPRVSSTEHLFTQILQPMILSSSLNHKVTQCQYFHNLEFPDLILVPNIFDLHCRMNATKSLILLIPFANPPIPKVLNLK